MNAGTWWTEGALLKLAMGTDRRTYRILWLDGNTFDLRWVSDADEEAWWKGFYARGKYRDWHCEVHIAHDDYGCCWHRSEFQKDGDYIVFDTVETPPRYVRSELPFEPVVPARRGMSTETPAVSNPPASRLP